MDEMEANAAAMPYCGRKLWFRVSLAVRKREEVHTVADANEAFQVATADRISEMEAGGSAGQGPPRDMGEARGRPGRRAAQRHGAVTPATARCAHA